MMKDEITVVCQGAINSCLQEVLTNYLDAGLLVVYSGWTHEPCPFTHPNLVVCYSQDPANPGVGNRNRQIVSSRRGLELVRSKYAWKVRSDQIYPTLSVEKCLKFFDEHPDKDRRLFTPGLYTKEVFHVRDHQILGKTNELRRFWNCELDEYNGPADYNEVMRAETYLVVNYLDFYSSAAMNMRLNYREYLLDNSPKRAEALAKSNEIMPKYFVPFPKVDFKWRKHFGDGPYHYDYTSRVHGEWHSEDII